MRKHWLPAFLAVSALIPACAHEAEKKLDQKVSEETEVHHRSDLSNEATNLIQASSLSDVKKEQLLSLRDEVHQKNDSLIAESLKLRSVLIKDVIANYDADEIALIKKKIERAEKQRISNLFSAIDRANKILGREVATNRRIMGDMFEFRGSRGD